MTTLRLEIPAKLLPFQTQRKRHKIARGGRGGGKSWAIARLLVIRAYQGGLRCLCCREVQRSIRQSSKRLIEDQIKMLGLSSAFDIQRDVIYGPQGSEFHFAGLRDQDKDSIKSYEGFDIAWVEEAHSVSKGSANVLIPTIRKEGSEIWWSYNPDLADDFVHELAASGREDVMVVEINYCDNPWFPSTLDSERFELKKISKPLYDHVWGGGLRSAAGVMFKRDWFQFYDVLPRKLNYFMASDYAGAPDEDNPDTEPDDTSHGVWGVSPNGDLYAVDWWSDKKDPSEWIDEALALAKKYKPLAWFEEKGPILRSLDSSIKKRMRETNTFVRRISLPSASSKADRALGFAARASARAVYLPSGKPWSIRLLNQLCAFTGKEGRDDDDVDVCSLIGRGLDNMPNAAPESPSGDKDPMDDYIDPDDTGDNSWKIA